MMIVDKTRDEVQIRLAEATRFVKQTLDNVTKFDLKTKIKKMLQDMVHIIG